MTRNAEMQSGDASLENARQELVQRYGPWMVTNIRLGSGIYTIGENKAPVNPLLTRYGQLIADISDQPLSALRVLDLACLEGEYAIEFARQGAEAVGVEGREANIEKARFVKRALRLETLRLEQDDVRNLSVQKYGSFDAVLCSGILYHLEAPDVLNFVERMSEVCRRCLIVDTHISMAGKESFTYKDHVYWGTRFIEHHRKSSQRERQNHRLASLDNLTSFWLTRPSLYNALTMAGFTSVYECHVPVVLGRAADRVTFVAIKGKRYEPIAASDAGIPRRWPEKPRSNFSYYARLYGRALAMRLPHPLTQLLRRMFRA
jgi:2-polyprenyl-3-methyl-5-hydroxy-6-metoxy-1,4-benzoquinol methylase